MPATTYLLSSFGCYFIIFNSLNHESGFVVAFIDQFGQWPFGEVVIRFLRVFVLVFVNRHSVALLHVTAVNKHVT